MQPAGPRHFNVPITSYLGTVVLGQTSTGPTLGLLRNLTLLDSTIVRT